jgi:uncharacterized protein YciI
VTVHQLVRLQHGPAWDEAKGREQPGWDAHAALMDELVAQGTIVLGGPIGDGDGEDSLLVIDAPDEAGARAALAGDPWLDSVLAVRSIERWSVWLRPADG